MKNILSAVIGSIVLACAGLLSQAQEATWEYAVQVSSTVQSSPPQIQLGWPQDVRAVPNSYTVYRKAQSATSWGTGTSLAGTSTSYTDSNVAVGSTYEYQIVKQSPLGYTGYGYILAGIQAPLVDNRGKVVLIVDNTYAASLAAELAVLRQDLVGDGWTVLRHDVARTDSPASVKNLIKADYNADPSRVKTVFLFGRVPVLRSGSLNVDGHQARPMPADVFYGDMDGAWTDANGDGVYDQSYLPSDVELQVGRVDFANMTGATGGATWPSELALLRQYLNKDHAFRQKVLTAPMRGLVGDRFGMFNGEAFAASGFRNFSTFFGAGNTTIANASDTAPVSEKWISYLGANRYLWAYGCGGGSATSMSGLGTHGLYTDVWSTDIVGQDGKAIFNLQFGSWLCDWDTPDNIMRSTLATPTMGLTCSWSGRPHHYYHYMALGDTVGNGIRLSQNNNGLYQNQINSQLRGVHIALMGDPTLRMHQIAPAGIPSGSLGAAGAQLAWSPSADTVQGYHVYRAGTADGPFTRLTSSPVSGTSFTDSSVSSGSYVYMVRAIRLESTPSGSYFNASEGTIATVGVGTSTADTTPPSVSLTAPASNATVLGSAFMISAIASDNVGVVGVQFKLDGANLGSELTSAPYNLTWNTTTAANGSHALSAVARDAAGNSTPSPALSVTVNNLVISTALPTVTVVASDATATIGTSDVGTFTFNRSGDTSSALTVNYTLGGTAVKWTDYRRPEGNIPVSMVIPAGATSTNINISAIGNSTGANPETVVLTLASDPAYTIASPSSATVTLLNGSSSSTTTTTTTSTSTATNSTPSGLIWVDDAVPAGAWTGADGGDSWNWVSSNPAPLAGKSAHQSNVATGVHQHYFADASTKLTVNAGESLFAYVYLDPANPPSEIVLQWFDGTWAHRAYWGSNLLLWGADGTASLRSMGALPPVGQWVPLLVPANLVGLEGSAISGMSFTLYGGRATWDCVGKLNPTSASTTTTNTTSTSSISVSWIDDAIPAGAWTGADGGDSWNWVSTSPTPFAGNSAHQSNVATGVHQHYFADASAKLTISTGESLFAYVYLDPANPPSEIVLQWFDGTWAHRAYWGANLLLWGTDGTASQRPMGALPPTGQWVRLFVPANLVGLEGSAISGMSFTLFGGRATWDNVGKTNASF